MSFLEAKRFSENFVADDLPKWFTERPKWLQVATQRLLRYEKLSDDVISELKDLCLREVDGEFIISDKGLDISFDDFLNKNTSNKIHLCSIGEITGVNRLAPKKPLEFEDSDIVVVYGKNGSGKSSYVRLLKYICGVRDCLRGELYKDVFSTEEADPKAKVTFLKNDVKESYEWSGKGVCDDLCSIDIFDTSFGKVFMENEGEVCYEPPILSFFTRLVKVCDDVAAKLKKYEESLQSKMPKIPQNLAGTDEADWLKSIKAGISADEIDDHCSFTPKNNSELQNVCKRIAEQSPTDRADQMKNKKSYVEDLIETVKNYFTELSDENCKQIIEAKEDVSLKEKAAKVAAKEAFSDVELEGIGSKVWKELWEAARRYSQELAYKGKKFPVDDVEAACVLCLQTLSDEARKRFKSFETHIKDDTQMQAIRSEEKVTQLIKNLPEILSLEELRTRIDAAGIEDKHIVESLDGAVASIRNRKKKLLSSSEIEDDLVGLVPPQSLLDKLCKISKEYEETAKKYEADATKDNREELEKKQKNLEAKKWLSEQKAAIEEEVKRLNLLKKINKAKDKANTSSLSTKKKDISRMLITEAFVKRFKEELKVLKASKINVELDATEASKGKVFHKIKLTKTTHNDLSDILSEGEKGVVSIAAFLADARGRDHSSPLVFDDPTTSFDEDYEEAIVQRLCSIASERQIIIFTHRLSVLGKIKDCLKRNENKEPKEPKVICIYDEGSTGVGNPGSTPLYVEKPSKSLNVLIKELTKARKIFDDEGLSSSSYRKQAGYLCTEFRKLLERMVEHTLMSDIVARYRREVHTKGKIKNLAKISKEDCEFFDDLMTKYSIDEHNQPSELPVDARPIEELEEDFRNLKKWQDGFKNRPLPSD